MRELLPPLRAWHADGTAHGLATVVSVSRSAPRPAGTETPGAVHGTVAPGRDGAAPALSVAAGSRA